MLKYLVLITFICVLVVQCHPFFSTTEVTNYAPASETTTVDPDDVGLCDEGGWREKYDKYCGFGWRILEAADTEDWGRAILWMISLPFQLIAFVLISPVFLIMED